MTASPKKMLKNMAFQQVVFIAHASLKNYKAMIWIGVYSFPKTFLSVHVDRWNKQALGDTKSHIISERRIKTSQKLNVGQTFWATLLMSHYFIDPFGPLSSKHSFTFSKFDFYFTVSDVFYHDFTIFCLMTCVIIIS